MMNIDIFSGILSILFRLVSMLVFATLMKQQWTNFKYHAERKTDPEGQTFRKLLLLFLIAGFIQSILPIAVILTGFLSRVPINSTIYIMNNSSFALMQALLMLLIYIEE